MSPTVAAADWIARIVDGERQRDAERGRQAALTARKDDLVNRHGRRLLDDLRTTIIRDAEGFRDAFTGDASRDVGVTMGLPDGGFVVNKPPPSAVSLSITLNANSASLLCIYTFKSADNMPPREDRVHVMFIDGGGETLQMRDHGTGTTFATGDELSEFLLTPVLTGRPR